MCPLISCIGTLHFRHVTCTPASHRSPLLRATRLDSSKPRSTWQQDCFFMPECGIFRHSKRVSYPEVWVFTQELGYMPQRQILRDHAFTRGCCVIAKKNNSKKTILPPGGSAKHRRSVGPKPPPGSRSRPDARSVLR